VFKLTNIIKTYCLHLNPPNCWNKNTGSPG